MDKTKVTPTQELAEMLASMPEREAQEIARRILLIAQGMQLQMELQKTTAA